MKFKYEYAYRCEINKFAPMRIVSHLGAIWGLDHQRIWRFTNKDEFLTIIVLTACYHRVKILDDNDSMIHRYTAFSMAVADGLSPILDARTFITACAFTVSPLASAGSHAQKIPTNFNAAWLKNADSIFTKMQDARISLQETYFLHAREFNYIQTSTHSQSLIGLTSNLVNAIIVSSPLTDWISARHL